MGGCIYVCMHGSLYKLSAGSAATHKLACDAFDSRQGGHARALGDATGPLEKDIISPFAYLHAGYSEFLRLTAGCSPLDKTDNPLSRTMVTPCLTFSNNEERNSNGVAPTRILRTSLHPDARVLHASIRKQLSENRTGARHCAFSVATYMGRRDDYLQRPLGAGEPSFPQSGD